MSFEYPKEPAGLEPDMLFADALWRALTKDVVFPPSVAAPRPRPARVSPSSRYVGVYYHFSGRGRPVWRAGVWHQGTTVRGLYRPYTPAGELQAAWDYAQLKGLPGPMLKEAHDGA